MTEALQIRIEGHDLPGRTCRPGPDVSYQNIHVGVQRRSKPDELLGLLPGDAKAAAWTLECTVVPTQGGVDIKGPYVQGSLGGRFIYLSWGTVDEAQLTADDDPVASANDGGVRTDRCAHGRRP